MAADQGYELDDFPDLFSRIKEAFPSASTASIVHWAPINQRIASGAGVKEYLDSDDGVTQVACDLLGKPDCPDAMFVQLDDVDQA